MDILSAYNPEWANAEHTAVTLVIVMGFVGINGQPDQVVEQLPFTATPNDVEPYGRSIYHQAIAGDFGTIAPYQGN